MGRWDNNPRPGGSNTLLAPGLDTRAPPRVPSLGALAVQAPLGLRSPGVTQGLFEPGHGPWLLLGLLAVLLPAGLAVVAGWLGDSGRGARLRRVALVFLGASLLATTSGLVRALWTITHLAQVGAAQKAETLANGISRAMNSVVLGVAIVLCFTVGYVVGRAVGRRPETSLNQPGRDV